jgi:3-oxoacyl-[acyl-carrier protein] reductase
MISASDVEQAAASGSGHLVVGPGMLVSPLAADRARELSIQLHASGRAAADAGTAQVVRAALTRTLARRGTGDVDAAVREAIDEAWRTLAGQTATASADLTTIGPLLEGRVAIVTGAASGIGRAIAMALGAAGARVVIGTHRDDPNDAEETLVALEAMDAEGVIVDGDVRDEVQVSRLFEVALERWGRVDLAVPNAAIMRRESLVDMTDGAWEQVIDVNLAGVARVCRAAARNFPGSGAIVAVGSLAGSTTGWAEHTHYAAAKAGIVGLVRSLAVELGGRGIRVNAVLPGVIETAQSLDPSTSIGARGLVAAAERTPLGRVGAPEDVATAVRFLLSDEAAFISGQTLTVDGGITTVMPL